MARDDNQNQEKDFLDIDLDDPLESLGEEVPEEVARSVEAQAPSGDGILIYDNKRYAVGLNWLIAEEEGDAELAVKRAKDFKADFYVLRQGVVTQHGFGFLHKGHRIGVPALASVAADTLVGEWHGVFVADNGWWYVAVHADNLAPEGDILFASEEAAYNHFMAQSELFRWPRAYAPESWNIPDSSGDIPLNKIIGEVTPPPLKPVTLDAIFSGKRNKNLAIGAGLVIVMLIVLSIVGQQVLPSLVPMQAQVPVPNVEVSDTLQAPPKEPSVLLEEQGDGLVNMALVTPSTLITDCISGFSAVSLPLPGWKLTTLRCKETFVEAMWARVTGSYEMLEPFLTRFPEGTQRAFPDSSTLVVTRRLTGKRAMSAAQELYERNHAIITLSKRFGELGAFEVKEIIPAGSQQLLASIEMMQQAGFGGVGQNRPDIRPLTRDDLPYLSVQLRSKIPPNMINRYFDLPGLVVLGVETAVADGQWQYDAKLILRPEKRLIEANAKAKALQIR